ncbi:hypothetical protein RHGRI_023982 [Rhododendron griersonianum]|uniref:Uncharacterized protein n=1 Tax=Rhododendron griersonianum TaxID=479676 RepID=A0AAV6J6T5_9ERIC|nr:hypothetical protein RHGRI_023982 [Rhododendron griersonianum]
MAAGHGWSKFSDPPASVGTAAIRPFWAQQSSAAGVSPAVTDHALTSFLKFCDNSSDAAAMAALFLVAVQAVVQFTVASEDNGNVVKGPVVHVPSILDKGGQRATCEQSFQGQVNATTGSDSEVELMEDLERVVSSNQVSKNMVLLEPPASLEVGSGDTPHGILGLHPMEVEGVIVQAGIKPPEPPDLLGPKAKGTDAKPVPSTGLVNVNALQVCPETIEEAS